MKIVRSPITLSENVKFEKRLNVQKIKEGYSKNLSIDISYLLNNSINLGLYKCLDSCYYFYYPIAEGDSKFYEHLQQYEWYYMPWKWEHQQVVKLLKPKQKVLEVGCAKGDFLKKIKNEYNVDTIGLELNKSVGINNFILNETIQDHSKKNNEKYNIVCSFQVLEHISEVKSFIEAQISCLKKNGKLIISVPNNDSYLKHSFNVLNMPPHHLGLWNKKSLVNLQKYFPLELLDIRYEPLQNYHETYFKETVVNHLKSRYKIPLRISQKFSNYLKLFTTKKYQAFTVLAIYRKK